MRNEPPDEAKAGGSEKFCFDNDRIIELLREQALDMRCSWISSGSGDDIWKDIDPVLWGMTHDPWNMMQSLSLERWRFLLADETFREKVLKLISQRDSDNKRITWFQQNHADKYLKCVAYFSMEYMLSKALPVYSGGLGNVAGDQLKAASDLGVPVVGVGLLYQRGYFRQVVDRDGEQLSLFPYNDPAQLPIVPVRNEHGELFRLAIDLPGYSIWLRAWKVQVGKVSLYLLDCNDILNAPVHRMITSDLYGGGPEIRLKQEMVLGIGGWRLLKALGFSPGVCHLNEGHAAFAIIERARDYMQETGLSFEAALAVTRAGNLFTTHTAVAAGFDRFSPSLIEQHMGWYCKDQLGIALNDFLSLGRENGNDPSESFNMAYLALRGSAAVNGVSKLHGEVSRQLFAPLFHKWPKEDIPVSYVTNGVHIPSWESEAADELWASVSGSERWEQETEMLGNQIRHATDPEVWKMRTIGRKELIEYARYRLSQQLAFSGASELVIQRVNHLFDPNVLTMVFARRFATYKRPNLLLHDINRLIRILTNTERPVQLIIAGKAHPDDLPGRELIKKWMHFIHMQDMHKHVIFLNDYDMVLTEYMVQGADVWINTPMRLWEACGTSGMKILANGGLNISVLDGWWEEAFTPEVGWAIGKDRQHCDDHADANELYSIIENEIAPAFYARNANGIPVGWVSKIRDSMAGLTAQYSANRAVREYTEQHYLNLAKSYTERSLHKGASGREMAHWQQELKKNWAKIKFIDVIINTHEQEHFFEAKLLLGGIDPSAITLEVFADGLGSGGPEQHQMTRKSKYDNDEIQIYSALVPAYRYSSDYTLRVIPCFPGASVPMEAAYIHWHR